MRDQHLNNASEVPDPSAAEVKLSVSLYESIFLQAGIGLAVADENGRFLRVNTAFCDILSFDETTLFDEFSLSALVGEDHGDQLAQFFNRMSDIVEVKRPFLTPNHQQKWVQIKISRLKDNQQSYLMTTLYEESSNKVNSKQTRHLSESERLQRNDAETLHTITAALVSTLELDKVLALILEQLANVLDYDSASIFLIDEKFLFGVAEKGLSKPDDFIGKPFPLENPLFQSASRQNTPIWLADVQKYPQFEGWGGTVKTRGWMGIPLLARGKLIGFMTLDSSIPNSYGSEEAKLVQPIANQAAQVIENARLYDQVQRHAEKLEATIDELQQTQKQLLQQERLGAVGQLAAGIAHDFNNILAVILLYAQLLQRVATLTNIDYKRLETIIEQSTRASQLIQQILDFSRKSVIERQNIHLLSFMVEMKEILGRILPETIRISLEYSAVDYQVYADPTSLQQLLLNLSLNARDAMPQGGDLRLELQHLAFDTANPPPAAHLSLTDWILIRVSDTGVGIRAEIQQKLFEPFFTTKTPGKGTGLGLAQAYGIVQQHEGFIDFESTEGIGTVFNVYLPAQKVGVQKRSDQQTAVLQGNGETILLVEDELNARIALSDTLTQLHFKVIAVGDGEEALTILKQYEDDIAIVISDVVMPRMGGIELRKKLRETYPNMPLILMSGYAPVDSVQEEETKPGIWLKKPFTIEKLTHALQYALSF